jgi:FHA domain
MSAVAANPPAEAQGDAKALFEAERSGRPFLVYRDRDGRQRLFLFAADASSASVGRRPSSDLVLDWDAQVSRSHARFERADDGWALVDDGLSSNGTFVNEERLSGKRPLNDGDALRFGTTAVTFRSPAGQPRVAAVRLSTTQRRVLTALCRPYKDGSGLARPATDEQIAEELVLSVGEVRAHLKVLCAKLDLDGAPGMETRARLVERALSTGLVSERDL